MDPDATLAALLNAFRDNDRDAAAEHIEALAAWLAKGGFMPFDPRRPRWMSAPRRKS